MNSTVVAAAEILDDALTGEWTRGDQVDPNSLRKTAGSFPSGVTIITTTSGGNPIGLTISSFASVSLDPPLLLACVARTASSLPAFRVGGRMGVNVLANDQAWLAKRFASRQEDRFAGVELQPGSHDVPLLEGVAAWLNCHIARIYDGGDHVILLARVHTVHRSGARPLLYHSGKMHDWAIAALETTT
ncbi:flavin reductase family protein [Actinacidiphila soli]|uniref:flavin reductase family protein n=1 Tax=Actinacidiphila soli TaxID=2487275 RepID=UPI0019D29DC9|nr:flavin reductase family protein [Actinacidiphila soli]